MLVQDFLYQSAARLPDKVALVHGTQRYTYRDLDAATNRLANALRAIGLQRGDRVVVYLNNSVEAVIGIFAVLKAGGVFVIVNHTTKRDKLIYILNNSEASALLIDARQTMLADRIAASVPSLKTTVFCGKREKVSASAREKALAFTAVQQIAPPEPPTQVNIDRDLACLIYTSGTTGDPKGVMSDHSNVVFATGSIISYLKNVEDDIVLCAIPLSFDYGLYQLLMVFRFGGTLVLEHGFTYPAQVIRHIEDERVTGFPIVPTIMAILLQMDLSPYDFSKLRYITNTAAALPPSHISAFRSRFPEVAIYSMYGLTETKRTLYLPPEHLENHIDSVGIPIPGTEVWLEDENGRRLSPGNIGELVIRGRHVMRGYWRNEEATTARYRPGPLPGESVCHSGDLFRMDEEGFFYFVGRKDDIIKSRGEKVSPKEIENVLYQLPGVKEAAVIGVPDEIMGQAVKAFVVCSNGDLSRNEILAHCRANLEDIMMPKYLEFRKALPKTPSGKIAKKGLS
jgi:amino acid adenylation domain-containing protein